MLWWILSIPNSPDSMCGKCIPSPCFMTFLVSTLNFATQLKSSDWFPSFSNIAILYSPWAPSNTSLVFHCSTVWQLAQKDARSFGPFSRCGNPVLFVRKKTICKIQRARTPKKKPSPTVRGGNREVGSFSWEERCFYFANWEWYTVI